MIMSPRDDDVVVRLSAREARKLALLELDSRIARLERSQRRQLRELEQRQAQRSEVRKANATRTYVQQRMRNGVTAPKADTRRVGNTLVLGAGPIAREHRGHSGVGAAGFGDVKSYVRSRMGLPDSRPAVRRTDGGHTLELSACGHADSRGRVLTEAERRALLRIAGAGE